MLLFGLCTLFNHKIVQTATLPCTGLHSVVLTLVKEIGSNQNPTHPSVMRSRHLGLDSACDVDEMTSDLGKTLGRLAPHAHNSFLCLSVHEYASLVAVETHYTVKLFASLNKTYTCTLL